MTKYIRVPTALPLPSSGPYPPHPPSTRTNTRTPFYQLKRAAFHHTILLERAPIVLQLLALKKQLLSLHHDFGDLAYLVADILRPVRGGLDSESGHLAAIEMLDVYGYFVQGLG